MEFFKSVTWSEYFAFIGIACGLFYVFVLSKYFRSEAVDLLSGKLTAQKKNLIPVAGRAQVLQNPIMGPAKKVLGRNDTAVSSAFDSSVNTATYEEEESFDLAQTIEDPEDLPLESVYISLDELLLLYGNIYDQINTAGESDITLMQKVQELLAPYHYLENTSFRHGLDNILLGSMGGKAINQELVNKVWDNFHSEIDELSTSNAD